MKKSILAIFCLSALLLNTSCKDKDEEPLTPEESKQELAEVLSQAISSINAQDYSEIVTTSVILVNKVNYSLDSAFEKQLSGAVKEVINPVKKAAEMINDLIEMPKVVTNTNDDYERFYAKYQYELSLLYGKLVANDKDQTWEFDDSVKDHFELQFSDAEGNPVIFSISGTGKTSAIYVHTTDSEAYYPYYGEPSKTIDEEEMTILVPEQINVNLTSGQTKLLSLSIGASLNMEITESEKDFWGYDDDYNWFNEYASNSDLSFDKLSLDVKLELIDLAFSFNSKINQKEISLSTSFALGNQELISVKASSKGDFSNFVDMTEDGFESAKLEANFLSTLQFKANCNDIKSAVLAFESIEPGDNKSFNNFNNSYSAKFFFNNSDKATAKIKIQSFKDDDDFRTQQASYTIEPVIEFADGSVYRFDEYLAGEEFNDVMKAAEGLVNDFMGLLNNQQPLQKR